MFKFILSLIYPNICYSCNGKINNTNSNICENCLSKIKKRTPPFCTICGKSLSLETTIDICFDCKTKKPFFDRAFSIFYYDDTLKNLIHSLKYKKLTALTQDFSEIVTDFLKKSASFEKIDIITSIPMHPIKKFSRDINPSHELAKKVARNLQIKYEAKILKKTKNTISQNKLDRKKRITNLKNSFSLEKTKESIIKNKNILLIDDVFTTGTTLNECAKILKYHKVNSIKALTLARGR